MSKPWGNTVIGSWAAEAERAEAEEKEIGFSPAVAASPANPQSFPSLKEAVSTKPKKKKMTLSEFNTMSSGGGSHSSGSTRLTHDEILQLPTGPKQRSPDEFYGSGGPRLGGGFSNYGDDRRGPRRGGFDDDRRGGPRRGSDFDAPPPPPSRADEDDNWGAGKRFAPPPSDSGRGSRYGSLGGGSKADEVDNWSFGKKPASVGPPPGRSSTFGSSFRESGSDWRRGGDFREREEAGRPRLVLDPPSREHDVPVVVVKTDKPNPFGAARPREEVLAEKGLDWKKLDSEIEAKKIGSGGSRPNSSQGSRPASSQSNRSENVGLGSDVGVKPRAKVNPFGDAKPREVLLEEKGFDWKKIDLELDQRRINRPETEEERSLKEEIESIKNELEKESGGDVSEGLRDQLQIKEKDLEALIRELDDKVRFGPRNVEGHGSGRFTSFPERPPSQSTGDRPSSGAGRFTGFSDRPQSGSFEDARYPETMDRPRSRGKADVWTRPGEDRRGSFQGARDRGDRGFLGNRDFDRNRSKERW